MEADSGNGSHLRFRIDLPNDADSKRLIEACLKALAAMFNDGVNKVDTTVHNADRICKIYGTWVAKGDDMPAHNGMPARPHRLCHILADGDDTLVTVEQLTALAGEHLKPPKPKVKTNGKPQTSGLLVQSSFRKHDWQPEEMEELLDAYDIEYGTRRDYKGGYKWQLDECPFNPDHRSPDSCVYLLPDEEGKEEGLHPVFKCSHDGCQEFKGWNLIKAKLLELRPEVNGNFYESAGGTTGTLNNANGKNNDETKKVRKLVVKRFSDVKEKPTTYLWRPYFPYGELTISSGDPSTAKSTFALKVAAMLTRGKKFSEFGTEVVDCEPQSVLIIASEDSAEKTLIKRFRLLGGDPARMFALELIEYDENSPEPFVLTLTAADMPLIEDAVQDYDAKMLIIDPLACYSGDLNLNQSSQMRKVTTPLWRMADKYDMVVDAIRHNRKSDEGKAIYKGGGSIDGTGAARSELMFTSAGSENGNENPLCCHPLRIALRSLSPSTSSATLMWKVQAWRIRFATAYCK